VNRNRTILLVEDNPDDVELTRRALARSNIASDLVVARDGAEALDYLFSARGDDHPLPQLVLLDLKLPKVDGLEVLQRVREDKRTKLLRIVVLTSSNEDEDKLRSYDLGASSFVRKPLDFGEFVEAARQLGQYWLVLNEPPPSTL
jgi:two-component system, response regulator